MTLEQKLIKAKAKRHNQFIKVAIGLITVSLLCVVVVLFISFGHINDDDAELISSSDSIEIEQSSVAVNPIQSPTVVDEQLRQTYINALSDYENKLKPELNKIDLTKWDQTRSQHIDTLEDEALSKFSIADYAGAVNSIEELTQRAQTMISDSQQEFEQAMSIAQSAYDADQYDDAKFQIANALMLDKTSVEAETLSTKIDKLPEILALLEKINTARVENKPEKELNLIKELIKLAPDREAVVERKQVLIDTINNKNFKSYIAQSYQAINQGNAEKAKQEIIAAKRIFPNRPEIRDAVLALQELEKKQRLETYRQKAQSAIASDDWVTAKKQLELALREQADDKAIQKSLLKATAIIALDNEFEKQIKNPYRLSNMQLVSTMKDKISQASVFVDASPSLNKKINELSHLIESMNKKVSVEITSDNQTNILVRGVGIVGITQLKTIQLTPGRYTFEGKRKGYKSKLIDVLIPYDQTSYSLSIYCDEPI
ncbi:MAG: hypothetical protein DRQ42_04725 [Gammaproteobacteria bacterium]|nr:MAG: hypothetical protein DRQ46_07355 [Gammaproteobacteria bacterium]RLA00775.1 MAG: hypothetical protein DRQ42_04725 [Gammaproteobacteria bacterium]